MQQTRRRFLVRSALISVLSKVVPALAVSPPAQTSPRVADATLRAYVDVLIPADETPSGTALGVDKQLLAVAAGKPPSQRLLDSGLEWLNDQARAKYGRNFPELEQGVREEIVHEASAAAEGTLPRVFFERTRTSAFFYYYGHPESWRGIRQYRGPPQPLGFSDYMQPPRAAR